MENNQEEEDNNIQVPPGYRFVPTDQELLEHYLVKRVFNEEEPRGHGIHTAYLYEFPPEQLTELYKENCENEWYFFTKRKRKYLEGGRPDRTADKTDKTGKIGFWKPINVVTKIYQVDGDGNNVVMGNKITLDYQIKDRPQERTQWKMNEYRVDGKFRNLPKNYSTSATDGIFDEWCLCKIYKSSRAPSNKNNTKGAAHVAAEVPRESTPGTSLTQQSNQHIAGEQDPNYSLQNTPAAFSHQHLIAQLNYNGQNARGSDKNFVQQTTTALFGGHHLIAQQGYNGQNIARLGTNIVQQTTTESFGDQNINGQSGINFVQHSTFSSFNNDAFSNQNNTNPMGNITNGNYGMHYNDNSLLAMLPILNDLFDEDADYAEPIRSLPPSELPMWPDYNFNHSSSSNSGRGQSSSDGVFNYDGFNQFRK